MTDEKLYQLCQQYGAQARLWRQKFIGLLPEVNRRRLYERKGYESIFVFAAKLAGISQEQVRLALNLEKRFEDKLALKSLLIEGEVSLSKLTRVASIATVVNERELAEKVRQLPREALETLVRDERGLVGQDGSRKPLFATKSLPVQTLDFELSQGLVAELNYLHAQGQDVDKILTDLLQARRRRIEEQKEALSEEAAPAASRYISAPIRRVLKEEYGEKCSIATCYKPAAIIHHSQRFGLASTHDPKYLAPLCRGHHAIAHAVDRRYRDARLAAIR